MEFDAYQKGTKKTAIYPKDNSVFGASYPYLGLASEVGEVCAIYKRAIRDNNYDKEKLKLELGDCLWYISQIADDAGLKLDDVVKANLDKLEDRAKRGKLKGSGDYR